MVGYFFKLEEKVYLEDYRGSRSEPTELGRLRKPVTEAKEGQSLGERTIKCLGEEEEGGKGLVGCAACRENSTVVVF